MASANVDDTTLALGRQRAFRERHRENLIGPERIVEGGRPVDDVVTVLLARMPEAVETALDAVGKGVPGLGRASETPREPRHRTERVVPERVDLDGFADTRGHHPVAHLCIHPRELNTALPRAEQGVRRV